MTAHLRPSTIEELKRLWVALPVRAPEGMAGTDPRERQLAILESYCRALSEFSTEAIRQTVDDLEAGRIEDASKDFCPKPPKLAELTRGAQRRLDLMEAEERRRATPVITNRRDEFTDEHREEMRYKLELLSKSLRGHRESTAILFKMMPGAELAANRKANEQREKARSEGLSLIEEGVSIDLFAVRASRRAYRAGARWLWAAQEVWEPAE